MFSENVQLVLPLDFEVLVPENDSVRLLSEVIDNMNLSLLNQAYSSKGRNASVPPRIMLKIMAYAYMEGIYSSRDIAKVCKRDINFMWLLENHPAPEHSTVNRFRKERLSSCMLSIFSELVCQLRDMNEVSFENIFIDGTKIEANANKYTFVWEKAISKNNEKLVVKIKDYFSDINHRYNTEYVYEEEHCKETLKNVASFLLNIKEDENIIFVYGTGKRKAQLQKDLEKAVELLEYKEKYEFHYNKFNGRSNYCKTDVDATFMHMKEDHMRNSQLKPGYNLQIGVEGGYVLYAEAFSNRNDVNTLIPFLENLKVVYPNNKVTNIVADAGYESEENYVYLEDNNQVPYIKPLTYDQWKKRSFKKLIGKRENMDYDEENDEYTCSQGRTLKATGTKTRTNKVTEHKTVITVYECENCEGCPVREKCTKAKENKKLYISKKMLAYRENSLKNITSPNGILLRLNRSIQAEGAFGAIKEDANFRRFYTRGKENITTEFLLLCFGLNLNKLHKKRLRNQKGVILHKDEHAVA